GGLAGRGGRVPGDVPGAGQEGRGGARPRPAGQLAVRRRLPHRPAGAGRRDQAASAREGGGAPGEIPGIAVRGKRGPAAGTGRGATPAAGTAPDRGGPLLPGGEDERGGGAAAALAHGHGQGAAGAGARPAAPAAEPPWLLTPLPAARPRRSRA